MARVVRDLTVLPATHAFIHERYEPYLCLPSRSWSSFYRPRRDERLSRPSWLVTYLDGLRVKKQSPKYSPGPMSINFVGSGQKIYKYGGSVRVGSIQF